MWLGILTLCLLRLINSVTGSSSPTTSLKSTAKPSHRALASTQVFVSLSASRIHGSARLDTPCRASRRDTSARVVKFRPEESLSSRARAPSQVSSQSLEGPAITDVLQERPSCSTTHTMNSRSTPPEVRLLTTPRRQLTGLNTARHDQWRRCRPARTSPRKCMHPGS
jgi:hypothetical protein